MHFLRPRSGTSLEALKCCWVCVPCYAYDGIEYIQQLTHSTAHEPTTQASDSTAVSKTIHL